MLVAAAVAAVAAAAARFCLSSVKGSSAKLGDGLCLDLREGVGAAAAASDSVAAGGLAESPED